MITADQVQAGQELYEKALAWKASYMVLASVCRDYPDNQYIPLIQMKVSMVNRLYWAGLQAEQRMAAHIAAVSGLSALLGSGDARAIELVAVVPFTSNMLISFSTKLCHFHNPEQFPIYDDFSRRATGITKPYSPIASWYDLYRRRVLDLIQQTGRSFSFAEMDRYFYLKGQKMAAALSPQAVERQSGEIKLLQAQFGHLWDRL